VTYRFYLIAKEVEQMIYSMKLNGMLHHLIFCFVNYFVLCVSFLLKCSFGFIRFIKS
jgi:hypothetical protein